MPDLDTELSALREDLRRSVDPPEVGRIAARHRQRRVRRRMQAAAAAAVLVVSVAIPLLRETQSDPIRPATRPPSPAAVLPTDPFLSTVQFADEEHGFALRTHCPDGTSESCSQELLTTSDGARWTPRGLPTPDRIGKHAFATISVLGPNEFVVQWPGSYGAPWFHSRDGGRTWAELTAADSADTVASIPDGGLLTYYCPDNRACTQGEYGLGALLPGSGTMARLATLPKLGHPQPGLAPTAGDRWWVVGQAPDHADRTVIAISDDAGRSWRTSDLGLPWNHRHWSVVGRSGTLYATVTGGFDGRMNGLGAILESTDGGQHWTQTFDYRDGHEPLATIGDPVVTADGRLIIKEASGGYDKVAEGDTFASDDGGRTFHRIEQQFAGWAWWTRAGYVAYPREGTVAETSADGEHWRRVEVG